MNLRSGRVMSTFVELRPLLPRLGASEGMAGDEKLPRLRLSTVANSSSPSSEEGGEEEGGRATALDIVLTMLCW